MGDKIHIIRSLQKNQNRPPSREAGGVGRKKEVKRPVTVGFSLPHSSSQPIFSEANIHKASEKPNQVTFGALSKSLSACQLKSHLSSKQRPSKHSKAGISSHSQLNAHTRPVTSLSMLGGLHEIKNESKASLGIQYSKLHKVDDVSFVLRKQTSTPKRAFRSDAIDLEVSLAERLREIDSTNTYGNHDRFQLFQDLFSQIIDRDVVFGQLLRKVKDAYEAYFFDGAKNDFAHQERPIHLDKIFLERKNLQERVSVLEREVYEKQKLNHILEADISHTRQMLGTKSQEVSKLKDVIASLQKPQIDMPDSIEDAIVENSKLRQQMSILEKRLMQYEAMCSGNHMYPESNSDMYSYPYGDSQEDPAEDDPTEDDVDENAAKFDLDLKGSESEPDDVSSSFTPRLAVGEPFMIERPKIIPKLDFSHLEKEASESEHSSEIGDEDEDEDEDAEATNSNGNALKYFQYFDLEDSLDLEDEDIDELKDMLELPSQLLEKKIKALDGEASWNAKSKNYPSLNHSSSKSELPPLPFHPSTMYKEINPNRKKKDTLGFQEEFMSHSDQFSLSWREQLKAEVCI